MEHTELVQEMVLLEKMTAQERLKHARRRRQQQLKNWTQREVVVSNSTTVSNGLVNGTQTTTTKSIKASSKTKKNSVKFPENVVLLEGIGFTLLTIEEKNRDMIFFFSSRFVSSYSTTRYRRSSSTSSIRKIQSQYSE